jgi:putative transposase
VTGGTYFFTVNLAERKCTMLVDHADVIRAVMQKVKTTHTFHSDAAQVILPDHLHALRTLTVAMQITQRRGR